MKVLILGGSGMLGHKLWQTFASRFDAYATFRGSVDDCGTAGIFDPARSIGGISVQDLGSVERVLAGNRPDVVVNSIGVVKQDAAAKDPLTSIEVNALFPHRLAKACAEIGARLIHLSTDCVFSGQRGNYSLSDPADATDLYGRTKLLGEVNYDHCLTLRTSMIGRELTGSHGLVEWFLSQQGKAVRGYKKAVFSGFTTVTLASAIADIISDHPELHGVWHFAAEPINKFDLLALIKEGFNLSIEIEPDENFVCDRSLNGDAFRQATGYVAPSWPTMVEALVRDTTPYEEIRRRSC